MLWIAPHWDDLILSMPHRMLTGGLAGHTALIVYSEEDDVLAERSHAAMAEAGMTIKAMGLDEARRRGESLRACLKPDRRAPLDPAAVAALGQALLAYDTADQPWVVNRTIVHLDHALCRAAALIAPVRHRPALLAYRDQPYDIFWPRGEDDGAVDAPPTGMTPATPSALEALLSPFTEFVGTRTIARLAAAFAEGTDRERLATLSPALSPAYEAQP